MTLFGSAKILTSKKGSTFRSDCGIKIRIVIMRTSAIYRAKRALLYSL